MDQFDSEIIQARIRAEQLGFPYDRKTIVELFQGLGYTNGDDVGARFDRLFPEEAKPVKNRLTLGLKKT